MDSDPMYASRCRACGVSTLSGVAAIHEAFAAGWRAHRDQQTEWGDSTTLEDALACFVPAEPSHIPERPSDAFWDS